MPLSRTYLLVPIRVLIVCGYLNLSWVKPLRAEDHLSVKWQDYQEDDGRVRVVSRYVGGEKAITQSLALRLHGVHDTISGATPTGSNGRSGDELVYSEITDVRKAGVVDLDWTNGIHKTSFQFSHSKETDFLSKGYAIYNTSEYNKRNTGLSYGVSYIDDEIEPSFFSETRYKESVDGHFGISQVLDPNTIASVTFTYSKFDGYLADPYKSIANNFEVLPEFFLFQEVPENRPDERLRRIWLANVKRFYPGLRGSVDFDYRYFDDSWGIESHTFDFEWYQKFGDRFTLRPSYRYYTQGAADFYLTNLNGADIDPLDTKEGLVPYYSADYRLAKMATETYGIKAIYKVSDSVSWDVSWERYEMKGRDGKTLEETFPSADILTIGGNWWF
ncbi:DUF3570 domain-containing protein [Pelagicoccus sp. SDUM812002]|uniref:DUF3570 domain-containing protein n=1 Tax=Pelagicoccus sp. SDUM812002 TaxID=3041266 RepID=UPI00280C4298|nr:DUF3570 domain-containing protein [Pelagicoccus sp. SDUM812002]MDQ8186515.1 DUF3570 domain-containing protein [Pelagicoccus sp. SDUM812002]